MVDLPSSKEVRSAILGYRINLTYPSLNFLPLFSKSFRFVTIFASCLSSCPSSYLPSCLPIGMPAWFAELGQFSQRLPLQSGSRLAAGRDRRNLNQRALKRDESFFVALEFD
jgi:hypothetical protein